MIEIHSENDFKKDVLESKEPVIVDFNATWCGPCQMLKPTMESISKDYKVASVDTDENEELAYKYGVMSIPCIVLIKDGKEVNRLVGLQSKEEILSMLK